MKNTLGLAHKLWWKTADRKLAGATNGASHLSDQICFLGD
jgi:hypothetical protein